MKYALKYVFKGKYALKYVYKGKYAFMHKICKICGNKHVSFFLKFYETNFAAIFFLIGALVKNMQNHNFPKPGDNKL